MKARELVTLLRSLRDALFVSSVAIFLFLLLQSVLHGSEWAFKHFRDPNVVGAFLILWFVWTVVLIRLRLR